MILAIWPWLTVDLQILSQSYLYSKSEKVRTCSKNRLKRKLLMTFTQRPSSCPKKPLKNQLERQNLVSLWCYPRHGYSEASQDSQREDHWGMAIPSSPPISKDGAAFAGHLNPHTRCRKHSAGWKCKYLSSTAWHSAGREGLQAPGGSLCYTHMQSVQPQGALPGDSHSLAILWHQFMLCVAWVLFYVFWFP